MDGSPSPRPALSSYHRWLLFFLSVAAFFEGYDLFALSQVLPSIRAEMGLSKADTGVLTGCISTGVLFSYVLVRGADRWGRRRVLALTILGYTLATVLTGLSRNVHVFGVCQFVARFFLGAEWAVATVVAAEEFPAERRGTLIGVIHALNACGAIVAAGSAPLLVATPLGWRGVYFIGAVPLLLMAIARRSLRESRRFSEQVKEPPPLFSARLFARPWRSRVLLLGLVWALTYACTACAVTFWKDHVVSERGVSDAGAGANIAIASIVATPLAFCTGKLIDLAGRRWGAVVIYGLTILGTLGSYNATARPLVIASLIAVTVGITGVGVVMSAYNAELFPTDLRGDAFGWANNVLGRLTPLVMLPTVGIFAEGIGWGKAVSLTTLGPFIGLILVLLLFPETSGRELEETSELQLR